MKFLCLCYYVKLIGSLAWPEQWSTFVPKNGKPEHRPGPFSDDTRRAGAFFIVEAKDMEEARSVASRHPAANFGEALGFAVEVRPCESYEELIR